MGQTAEYSEETCAKKQHLPGASKPPPSLQTVSVHLVHLVEHSPCVWSHPLQQSPPRPCLPVPGLLPGRLDRVQTDLRFSALSPERPCRLSPSGVSVEVHPYISLLLLHLSGCLASRCDRFPSIGRRSSPLTAQLTPVRCVSLTSLDAASIRARLVAPHRKNNIPPSVVSKAAAGTTSEIAFILLAS